MASQRRRLAQKGVSLLVGTASMVLLIPSAGLAIDAALLYYTKARLQGAVDGAALAAARVFVVRLLHSGSGRHREAERRELVLRQFPYYIVGHLQHPNGSEHGPGVRRSQQS